MQSIASVVDKIKSMPATPPAQSRPWAMPEKGIHLFAIDELNEAIAHCDTCNGTGWFRSDDVPIADPRFGKLTRCPRCSPYIAELAMRERLERMRPLLERYSMLKGDLREKTFDNFKRQRAADTFAAVRKWATGVWKGSPASPWLFVWGAPGNGKTHLAAAAANGLTAVNIPVVFSTFTEICGMAADNNFSDKEAIIRALQSVPVLIVDDITEQELQTEWKQSFMFRVLDSRYVGRLPTLLISNMPVSGGPVSINTFEPRIASRLTDRAVCEIVTNAAPDFRAL